MMSTRNVPSLVAAAALMMCAACARQGPRPDTATAGESAVAAPPTATAGEDGSRTPPVGTAPPGGAEGDDSAGATHAPAPVPPPRLADSLYRVRPALVPVPSPLRGLYVNRWAAIGGRMQELIGVAKRTEVNALVIDVKDDRGFMLYPSRVALAREIGADAMNDTIRPMSLRRMRAILDTMRTHGIYPIARIVVAKDPLLARRRSDFAIRRKSDGTPWLDQQRTPWLDPHHPEVWDYAADLAVEAVDLGFSEVQLDYVRFPDDNRMVREAAFPLANGRFRAQVIRDQLQRIEARLDTAGVRMTIDIFGLTTSDTTDMGIGQRWEMLAGVADAVLPMMYPSHYAPGSYGFARPNANPHGIIDKGLKDAKRRSAGLATAPEVIPWYQDFTLGAPRYGAEQIRAQIRAGYENGYPSWILWNPRSVYTLGALQPDSGRADTPARVPPPAPPKP